MSGRGLVYSVKHGMYMCVRCTPAVLCSMSCACVLSHAHVVSALVPCCHICATMLHVQCHNMCHMLCAMSSHVLCHDGHTCQGSPMSL